MQIKFQAAAWFHGIRGPNSNSTIWILYFLHELKLPFKFIALNSTIWIMKWELNNCNTNFTSISQNHAKFNQPTLPPPLQKKQSRAAHWPISLLALNLLLSSLFLALTQSPSFLVEIKVPFLIYSWYITSMATMTVTTILVKVV